MESWINATKGQEIKDDEMIICKGHRQSCKTESILFQDLCELLARIYLKWCALEEYLNTPAQINGQNSEEAFAVFPNDKKQGQLIRTFAADRLNEVRFLFKSSDYEFEGEVRIVYTDSDVKSNAKTNYNCDVPRVYVEVDKELKNLTIRLGSKISDAAVDQLMTWLKHTGRVKKVEFAKRNRYTKDYGIRSNELNEKWDSLIDELRDYLKSLSERNDQLHSETDWSFIHIEDSDLPAFFSYAAIQNALVYVIYILFF